MDPYAGMPNKEAREHRERIVREMEDAEKAIEERRETSMNRVLDRKANKKRKKKLFRP